MKIVSQNLEDTTKVAKDFLQSIKPSSNKATVVGLYGNLGAGKTTFTQAVAKQLGIKETVSSPTFVIEKIYTVLHTAFTHFIHIDAYRLESADELLHLGWEEITSNPKNLIFIEWPEKVASILPSDMMKVQLTFIDETTREIEW